jgi:hypothetical protein
MGAFAPRPSRLRSPCKHEIAFKAARANERFSAFVRQAPEPDFEQSQLQARCRLKLTDSKLRDIHDPSRTRSKIVDDEEVRVGAVDLCVGKELTIR